MDWTLEVVVIPVSDVDRAKEFYVDRLGFALDLDDTRADLRVVQTTPPGSSCSVTFGRGLHPGEPGSAKGMQLCVSDIQAARDHLVSHGVACSPVRHWATRAGRTARAAAGTPSSSSTTRTATRGPSRRSRPTDARRCGSAGRG